MTMNPTVDNRKITNAPGLYNPVQHGYSFAASARGEVVYFAGHWASDPAGNVIEGDFATQVDQTIRNLGISLTAEGLDWVHVVRIGSFVVDHDLAKLSTLTAALQAVWGDRPPAQSLVPVPVLALPGMLYELEATAVRPTA